MISVMLMGVPPFGVSPSALADANIAYLRKYAKKFFKKFFKTAPKWGQQGKNICNNEGVGMSLHPPSFCRCAGSVRVCGAPPAVGETGQYPAPVRMRAAAGQVRSAQLGGIDCCFMPGWGRAAKRKDGGLHGIDIKAKEVCTRVHG